MSTRLATALLYHLGLTKEVLLREIGEGLGGAAGHGRGETQARSQPQPILQRERALGGSQSSECPCDRRHVSWASSSSAWQASGWHYQPLAGGSRQNAVVSAGSFEFFI